MLTKEGNALLYAAQQAATPVERREVTDMLCRLEGAISDAQAAVATLGERLGPMRMAVPTKATDSAQQLSACSPLGRALAENFNRLKLLTNTVNELTEELAI